MTEPFTVNILDPSTHRSAAEIGTGPCLARIDLGGDYGCVQQFVPDPRTTFGLAVTWPAHQVTIMALGNNLIEKQQALAIIRSAHAVPIDRNGCSASTAPPDPHQTGKRPPPLPLPPDEVSVCLYSAEHRLAASALLTGTGAIRLATAERMLTTTYNAACDMVAAGGDELRVTGTAGGRSVTATLFAARCGSVGSFNSFVALLLPVAGIPIG